MPRPPFAAAVPAALLLASCIQTAGTPGASGGSASEALVDRQGECTAPRLVLAGPSRFEQALVVWCKAPLGSKRGIEALEKACDESTDGTARGTEHAACAMLGLIHSSGEGVPRDPEKAFSFLHRGAQCGFSFGAMDLSQAAGHGILGRSVGCCGGISCEKGCEAECARAATAIRDAVVPPLEGACAEGRGVACFMLADIVRGEYVQRVGYVRIPETPRSEADADALIAKACKAGVGPACLHQAYRTDDSETAKVAALMQRACDLGWGDACLTIGQKKDEAGQRALAVPYWEKACKLRLLTVCGELATILSKGDGVQKDPERASAAEAAAWR